MIRTAMIILIAILVAAVGFICIVGNMLKDHEACQPEDGEYNEGVEWEDDEPH